MNFLCHLGENIFLFLFFFADNKFQIGVDKIVPEGTWSFAMTAEESEITRFDIMYCTLCLWLSTYISSHRKVAAGFISLIPFSRSVWWCSTNTDRKLKQTEIATNSCIYITWRSCSRSREASDWHAGLFPGTRTLSDTQQHLRSHRLCQWWIRLRKGWIGGHNGAGVRLATRDEGWRNE